MSEVKPRRIQIRRKEKKSYLPPKVKANAKRVIGSVFKDRRPLGLADEELEQKLLKKYADIRVDDRDYGEKKAEFWKNMRVEVPSEGRVLNITTKDGEPAELEDYIIYKWLENHPLVAEDKQAMLDDSNKEFYLYDPEEEIRSENKGVQARKDAYKALLKIEEDEAVCDQLLRLLGDKKPEKMSREMKENELEQLTRTQPRRFLKYAEDPNLALRAEIEEMVEYGVLRKSGNQYIYMDEVIGDTIDDAIVYFKNDRNSSTVLDLRAKLKEAKEIA